MDKYIKYLIILFLLTSCLKYNSSNITKKNYNYLKIKKIAVVTFYDYDGFKNSGQILKDALIMALMKKDIDIIFLNKDIKEIDISGLSEKYKIDAILTGSITRFIKEKKIAIISKNKVSTNSLVTINNPKILITDSDVLWLPEETYDVQAEVGVIAKLIDIDDNIIWMDKAYSQAFTIDSALEDTAKQLADSLYKTLRK